jgi:hypothetical protein
VDVFMDIAHLTRPLACVLIWARSRR